MLRIVLAVMMVTAIVGVVGLLVLPPVAAQASPSATRPFDKTTVEPGGEVVVTITVADYGATGGVVETLPTGFTYETSSLSAARVNGQRVEFGLIGTTSFTYTVTAPSTTGTFTFNGTLQDHDTNPYPVGGASTVTVAAPTGPTPSATRSFDKTTVEPGGAVVVTITVADYGDTGGVAETLPTGFTYETSSLSAARVNGQRVEFGLIGTTSFTYTVTAPSTTGTFTFRGTLQDHDRDSYPVGGPSGVTVAAPSGPTPSATRSFDKTTVEPGGEVVVTITVADYGDTGGVAETLPTGFTYETSSLSAARVNGQRVEFGLIGTTSFTYTVTAPSATGRFTFRGTLQDHDRDSYPVGGATRVTVRAPQPVTPPRPPTNTAPVFRSAAAVSVAENTTAVVTVRATDRDSQDRVTGYAIIGGADSSKFFIVAATGELFFTTAPDFENPADADADNEYVLAVRATSGAGGRVKTAIQTIRVTVTDVAEAPALNPYDVDDSGVIEGPEVIQAVKDYFAGSISGPEVIAVVKLYFAGRTS